MRDFHSVLALLLAAAAVRPPVAALPAWFEESPVELSAPSPRPIDQLLWERQIDADDLARRVEAAVHQF
jgi:hypothetical protein